MIRLHFPASLTFVCGATNGLISKQCDACRMARYVIPSVTISALYSGYKFFSWGTGKSPVNNVDDAVEGLNNNKNVQESYKYLSECKEPVYIDRLNERARGLLALRGSVICQQLHVQRHEQHEDFSIERLLNKFDLGAEWYEALAWLNRVACPEEDLSCSEEWLVRRPSQLERLLRVLEILFLKTEKEFDMACVGTEVIEFLLEVFRQFKTSNEEFSVLALKILSNVVLRDASYATTMLNSEWLQLLSTLVNDGSTLELRLHAHKICQNALHTLGVVDYNLRSDIYELHLADEAPEMDIVLIHGLRGSVTYTWRQHDGAANLNSECWPKDWLPLDIQQPFRILGMNYSSYLVQFSGSKETLQDRSTRFSSQLKEAGLGKRPIIFICHSMGGLLAKKLLLDNPQLAEKTVGILFMATPHRGSPVASWGYSILHPTSDVVLLHERNLENKKLHEDFANIGEKIPVIVSMAETKETNLIGNAKWIVVPSKSALFEKGAVYHIDDMHHNVCKPLERTSASYGVILNFVRDCFYEAKRKHMT